MSMKDLTIFNEHVLELLEIADQWITDAPIHPIFSVSEEVACVNEAAIEYTVHMQFHSKKRFGLILSPSKAVGLYIALKEDLEPNPNCATLHLQ